MQNSLTYKIYFVPSIKTREYRQFHAEDFEWKVNLFVKDTYENWE